VTRGFCGAVAAVAVLCGAAVFAHHSTTAEFDVSKRIALTGTLTKIDWVNPHIIIFLDAQDAKDPRVLERWKFESNPPAWFRRVGVNRSDFVKAVGQPVTVEGNRAKDGSRYGYLLKITFANGDALELVVGGLADAP
jgi:hypothetical protein